MKAMIFAAGLGTRLRPITNSRPKALVEINGVPLLKIIIEKLIKHGFNDLIINIHHFPGLMKNFLAENKFPEANITISDETDLLLDTGGGLKKASWFFNDGQPFLVHNVDILSDINLAELYNKHITNNAIATLACMERASSRQFLINSDYELCGWKNNKTGTVKISKGKESELKSISFCGIHVINSELLKLISEDGVFSMIDVYLRLAANYKIQTTPYNNAKWIDIGSLENLDKANSLI
jgi:NDP-sugar pyrophosphorylase family protein